MGSHPHFEGSVGSVDPGVALTDDLGICCQNHRQVHPGVGCLMHI
jgi:hypothetical protein